MWFLRCLYVCVRVYVWPSCGQIGSKKFLWVTDVVHDETSRVFLRPGILIWLNKFHCLTFCTLNNPSPGCHLYLKSLFFWQGCSCKKYILNWTKLENFSTFWLEKNTYLEKSLNFRWLNPTDYLLQYLSIHNLETNFFPWFCLPCL